MSSARDLRQGEAISSVAAAVNHILGDNPIFWRGKVWPAFVSEQWSVAFLKQKVRASELFYAVRADG